ncbi:oligosaccharide flippase family protein, partial [Desulfobulbus alkaliphilus]|uniref:oligosaccharide flippase family protein n=1 Tax=Desulfobulbus alkaliphilus TaxID=869814 RepID=UPI0019634BC5|nr:oligosaccharide flippase family protein [Desulfobulbus alkaliphilus]
MKSDSLTKQASLLMAGRILSMPLTFLVPIVLVRVFTVEEFGVYKQLFMIFYVILPIVDLGISQSLFYFMPKYAEYRDRILSQTFLFQIPIILGLTIIFFVFSQEIGSLFSGDGGTLADYIPLLGIFALLWHLSNILENILIVEKKAFQAGAVTFFSESLRAIVSMVIGLLGGSLEHLMMGLVGTAILRCAFMGWYLQRTMRFSFQLNGSLVYSQLSYSLPFGLAIIVNTLVLFSHQYIVSISTGPADFAIYAVGCFSLPVFAIVVDSLVKVSLVRMSEATNQANSSVIISQIIYDTIRKLWIIFFPIFVFLFVVSEEMIVLLFTENYRDSVSIFRVFIFSIPLYALLLQHVPRVFSMTYFILFNNTFFLILSIFNCFIFYKLFGLLGPALGFVFSNFVWRIIFLIKCKKILKVNIVNLIPLAQILRVFLIFSFLGLSIFFIKNLLFISYYSSFAFSFVLYW